MPQVASNFPPDASQVLTKALARASERLGLSQGELAKTLGVSPATASRLYGGNFLLAPESTEGQLGLLVLRVFRSLDALLGGEASQIKAWLRASNLHLNGIPAEHIQRIDGLVHVSDYLDAMRGKL